MLIRNVGALLGPDLDFASSTDVRVARGRFAGAAPRLARRGREEILDGEGLLMIPGLINMHTHLGDSIGKDVALGGSADARIHPVHGAKRSILSRTDPGRLVEFMEGSCASMLRRGTTTFVDFREGGRGGVLMLRAALSRVPIRGVILGRVESYHDAAQVRQNAPLGAAAGEIDGLLGSCDGLCISGANENSDAALQEYSRTRKIRAIHSSETVQSVRASKRITGRSETSRALLAKPHFLVHMTHASPGDLREASARVRGVVVCPRANSALAEGVPDVTAMRSSGCVVGIGTDNVMINPPDMLREMDYLWKVTMGMRRERMDPREVLKMATVNGGRILGRNVGVIAEGMAADCVLIDRHAIDLEPMHDPCAAVVHRTSGSAIRAVMIGGRMVHGSL